MWCGVVCGVWCFVVLCGVVCGVWCAVRGVWCVVCGVWCVVCGVWCVVCGVWCVVCGVWCVVRGVWCVVCYVRCVVWCCMSCVVYCVVLCGVQCALCGGRGVVIVDARRRDVRQHVFLCCRRRIGKPFRPATQDWLVENDYRIWLFEKSKDRKQLNFPDTVSVKE